MINNYFGGKNGEHLFRDNIINLYGSRKLEIHDCVYEILKSEFLTGPHPIQPHPSPTCTHGNDRSCWFPPPLIQNLNLALRCVCV